MAPFVYISPSSSNDIQDQGLIVTDVLVCKEKGVTGKKGEKLSSKRLVLPNKRSAAVCGAALRQECFMDPSCLGPIAQPQVQPSVVSRPPLVGTYSTAPGTTQCCIQASVGGDL